MGNVAKKMISRAIIIPTGDELKSGIVLDTDSPMIMQALLSMNGSCNITRNEPLLDSEDLILEEKDFSEIYGKNGHMWNY